ncbi:MAG: TolC family protein [Gemmatimonadaceae bacterium]
MRALPGPRPSARPFHSRRRALRAPAVARLITAIASVAVSATARTGAAQVPSRDSASTAPPTPAVTRTTARSSALDSLVSEALAANPEVRAARARVDAARARVAPAGTRPDPTLMAGLINVPISQPSLRDDEMTMTMVGVGQQLPFPGKLGLRRRAAEREADAAAAGLERVQRDVARRTQDAYCELAYLDRALALAERQRAILAELIRAAELRFASGGAAQQDVLAARVEAARLGDEASGLAEARRAAAAELGALLGEPDPAAIGEAAVPERIARAAVADSAAAIRFAAATLGARVADSPLPPLAELQAAAVRTSPALREHEAMIAAQAARVDLARRETRPDVNVSLQYGQRVGRPDMVTAEVSLPLPVQRRRRQDQEVAGADAELRALEAEHHAQVNQLRAEVARLVSDAERARTQLALSKKAVLPQGQAALAAATAAYQAGRTDLRPVLEARSTLFGYETAYYRALSDFAKAIAALEAAVGSEVVR